MKTHHLCLNSFLSRWRGSLAKCLKAQVLRKDLVTSNPDSALPVTSLRNLGKLLNFSVPWFSHLQNGDNETYLSCWGRTAKIRKIIANTYILLVCIRHYSNHFIYVSSLMTTNSSQGQELLEICEVKTIFIKILSRMLLFGILIFSQVYSGVFQRLYDVLYDLLIENTKADIESS